MALINKPLVTDAMRRFRQTLGTRLSSEQADALALALPLPDREPLTLTAIRGIGNGTTQQARAVADHLVRQQLLDQLSDTQLQARTAIRQRFASEAESQSTLTGANTRADSPTTPGLGQEQVGTKSGLSPEQRIVLAPLLALNLVEMTIPDKPNSSKQRYRLIQQGKTLRDEMGE